VNGCGLRAVIERIGDGYGISVGPAWRRDRGFEPGMKVDVALLPEGPQRGDLAADVGSALEASPKAGALRCLELIDHVKEARAEHIVTRHGRPVARLGPAGKVASASALGVMQGTLLRYDQPYEPIPAVWSIDRDE
jgi:antitoxin (DNA-binding transcriptional repressor) of toxin-antitoxin stability system